MSKVPRWRNSLALLIIMICLTLRPALLMLCLPATSWISVASATRPTPPPLCLCSFSFLFKMSSQPYISAQFSFNLRKFWFFPAQPDVIYYLKKKIVKNKISPWSFHLTEMPPLLNSHSVSSLPLALYFYRKLFCWVVMSMCYLLF